MTKPFCNAVRHGLAITAYGAVNPCCASLDFTHISNIDNIVDYKNPEASLTERSRAYLDMNCAHCHNPKGWEASAQRPFDFRYETLLEQTGILRKKEKVVNTMMRGKMPFIGTTMLDEEGIELLKEFTESL